MKKLEIKQFGVLSTFKVTLYMMIIPSVLFFVIGVFMTLLAIALSQPELIFMGIIFMIVYPLTLLGFYGVMTMLAALIYNWLSGKFGGLEVYVSEKKDSELYFDDTSIPPSNEQDN